MKSLIDCNQENEPLESEINVFSFFIINYYVNYCDSGTNILTNYIVEYRRI